MRPIRRTMILVGIAMRLGVKAFRLSEMTLRLVGMGPRLVGNGTYYDYQKTGKLGPEVGCEGHVTDCKGDDT